MATPGTPVKVYYGKPMLPEVSRVVACLYEKDVKFELVDMYPNCYQSFDFLKLQATTRIPTPCFEDGKTLIFDSRAICRYIAEKYADRGSKYSLGMDLLDRALIEQWLKSEEQSFDPPSSALVFHLAFDPDMTGFENDPKLLQIAQKLARVLDVYDQRLSESKYLAGDYFTMADLSHIPNSYYLANSEWNYLFESRKNVLRWWEDISNRPSWTKVVELMKEVHDLREEHEKDEKETRSISIMNLQPLKSSSKAQSTKVSHAVPNPLTATVSFLPETGHGTLVPATEDSVEASIQSTGEPAFQITNSDSTMKASVLPTSASELIIQPGTKNQVPQQPASAISATQTQKNKASASSVQLTSPPDPQIVPPASTIQTFKQSTPRSDTASELTTKGKAISQPTGTKSELRHVQPSPDANLSVQQKAQQIQIAASQAQTQPRSPRTASGSEPTSLNKQTANSVSSAQPTNENGSISKTMLQQVQPETSFQSSNTTKGPVLKPKTETITETKNDAQATNQANQSSKTSSYDTNSQTSKLHTPLQLRNGVNQTTDDGISILYAQSLDKKPTTEPAANEILKPESGTKKQPQTDESAIKIDKTESSEQEKLSTETEETSLPKARESVNQNPMPLTTVSSSSALPNLSTNAEKPGTAEPGAIEKSSPS